MLIGVVGTTIAPWMQFYLQASIVEKGIKIEEYKFARFDVVMGAVAVHIVAFFIILVCAETLFKNGLQIETAKDAALSLASLAGNIVPISSPSDWSMPLSLLLRSFPFPLLISSVKV